MEDRMLHKALTEIFHERALTGAGLQVKELLRASEHTDRDSVIVKLILEREPGLGEIFPERNKLPLLWIAVLRCCQNSAELLVRSGADVNVRCGIKVAPFLSETITILHLVLQTYLSSWSERFIALLLDHGFDLRARDSHGQTVLHYAVNYGHVQATALLLDRGADVNVADIDGSTALLQATSLGECDEELVTLLMEHGADVLARDKFGTNVLHGLAQAREERVELARALIEKGASLDGRERLEQYQPIHLAVQKGKNKLVKLFLDHGADANARMHDGKFPLHLAATSKNLAALKVLLRRGANIDLKTSNGRTALHAACGVWYENEEIIGVLLSVGADMFVEDSDGNTPLTHIDDRDVRYPSSIRTMLKSLVLGKTCLQQPAIEVKDEQRIKQSHPMLWTCYQDCDEELSKTKSTRFIESCTLFDLLTKCQCQIAPLMRNCEFEKKFRQRDLEDFSSLYAEEIRRAYKRAKRYSRSLWKLEDLINEAVYNMLPWMLVRKVIRYIVSCDQCELKIIVRASRRDGGGNSDFPREQ